MNDLDSKIAEEIDDEALFRLAEGEEREFSPEYQQSMGRLYRKAGAHPRRRMRPIRKFIAIAAIVAVLTGAAAAATFWEEIQQFFVTTFGEYVELWSKEPETSAISGFALIPRDWGSFWLPSSEENKYSIIAASTIGKRKLIVFQDNSDELKLYQWAGSGGIRADNEATAIPGVYVGGEEVYAIEKKTDGIMYRTIFWTVNEITFELDGLPTFDELSEVANNLVLID